MTIENQSTNPYAAALADLRRKRAEIDNTIKVLEAMSGLSLADISIGEMGSDQPDTAQADNVAEGEPFLGMSIVDAAKKLLAARNRKMGNKEIAKELAAGGLVMKSADPVNTVGSVMTRRFNQVGDVVRVGRGTWGLKEWYPNQSFKPSGKSAATAEATDTERAPDKEERHREYDKFINDLVGGNGNG